MVKASFFCEIAMVTRGFETRLQILSSKEVHIVRRDGFNHVRDSIWRRHQPIFWSNAEAPENICSMFATRPMFQLPMFRLNAEAP